MSLVFAFWGMLGCPAPDRHDYESCILVEAEPIRQRATSFPYLQRKSLQDVLAALGAVHRERAVLCAAG